MRMHRVNSRHLRAMDVRSGPERGLMKAWYCADCSTEVEIDPHARCAVCGSDALARAEGRAEWPADDSDLTTAQPVGGHLNWDEHL